MMLFGVVTCFIITIIAAIITYKSSNPTLNLIAKILLHFFAVVFFILLFILLFGSAHAPIPTKPLLAI